MENLKTSIYESSTVTVSNFLSTENTTELIEGIFRGLSKSQKQISSRFFYDENGSDLFEEITALPEYYPTRTEKRILQDNAKTIIGEFEHIDIIELGSGDCSKISILFDNIPKHKICNTTYIPVDVSEAAVIKSTDLLACRYPGIKIHGLLADFMKHLDSLPGNSPRLICFFGSTLGNLTRVQAYSFLLNLKSIMKPGDRFLLGLDMVKDSETLYKAYNDKQGITAQFNLNMLNVINNVAETNFESSDFEHLAFYNEEKARVEMYLKALKDVVVSSNHFPDDIKISKGETIHTENSHKFTYNHIQKLAGHSGLSISKGYSDDRKFFSLVELSLPT